MWQNKIQTLWQSVEKANSSADVCKMLNSVSGQFVNKTYSDLKADLSKLDMQIPVSGNFKIALLMDKSYASLVSVLYCLFRGHCFIPIFSGSKIAADIISTISPDYIFSTSDTKLHFKTIDLRQVFHGPNSATNFAPSKLDPSGTAYIVSTSGTTGKPKLIPITFGQFSSYIENILPIVKNNSSFHLLQNFEISFDPYLFDIVACISNTSCLVPIANADIRNLDKVGKTLRNEIWISFTPSQAELVLSLFPKSKFASISRTFFLGEKLKTSLCQEWKWIFPETEIYNMYGPAETTVSVFCHKFEWDTDKKTYVPIGNIHKNHEYKINELNELNIKGPQVFSGYINGESVNDWFNTRDMVEIEDSKIFVLGRSDFQIKINGRRFQPEEMEQALSAAGLNGYIIPVTIDEKNKSKTHLVFATQNQSLQLSEVLKALQPKYDIDFIPKRVLYLEKFPMSQNGKIDRRQLAQNAAKKQT